MLFKNGDYLVKLHGGIPIQKSTVVTGKKKRLELGSL